MKLIVLIDLTIVVADHLIDLIADQNLVRDLDRLENIENLIHQADVDLTQDHHQDVAIHHHHPGLAHVIPLLLVHHYQFLILFNLILNLCQIKT